MQAKEEVIFTIIIIIIVLVFLAIMFLVFIAKNNTRKNRLLFENERIKREFEETLLNTRLEIQEHTLDYVSREIHDNIGQTLSLARLQMNSNELDEDMQVTDELLGKAIADLRILSHNLNTNHIKEQGFRESVESLARQFERTGKYKIKFLSDQHYFTVEDEKGLIIFRVIQEILNNITKHSNASEIQIEMNQSGNSSEIRIADNGKGFDPSKLKSEGIGLKNITDRINIVGGKLIITSGIGQGTEVKILLPNG